MKLALSGHPNMGWVQALEQYFDYSYVDVNDGNLSKFEPFDAIFYYIITDQSERKIPLQQIVPTIKKAFPKKPLLVFFDYELTKTPNNEWRDTFRAADVLMHCSPLDRLGAWQEVKSKCLFTPIPATYETIYKYREAMPVSFSSRDKKWVAIMQHTNPMSDLFPALMVLGKMNVPVKIFTAWFQRTNVQGLEFVAKSWGIKEVKGFPRLEPKEYFEELSQCYLAYDVCGFYVGWSRFIFECAAYNIPAVTNMSVAANRVANTDLCSDVPNEQQAKIQYLLDNITFRNLRGQKANEMLKYYCSIKRVMTMLKYRIESLERK